MSEHMFGSFQGHLSAGLVKKIETEFKSDRVYVHNYTEPRGEKRGWFSCRNLGFPFDAATSREVLAYARATARGKDRKTLGCDREVES